MIFFVGAGPGDVDLITVKGRKLLEEADVIIYAGSLVSKRQLDFVKDDAKIYDSSKMSLEEVLEVFKKSEEKRLVTVRLHTGDPGIYGAIGEQMKELDKLGIYYEVVPGVSSFSAANAAIKKEMTLPGVSQTIIITRNAGKTPVPEGEKLENLAKHHATMAIFLSISMIEEVVEKLLVGYEKTTPIAVVYRASWPEEKIIQGTLEDIVEKVKFENIGRQAMILVGDFLNTDFEYSKLYDKHFATGYRKAIPKDKKDE